MLTISSRFTGVEKVLAVAAKRPRSTERSSSCQSRPGPRITNLVDAEEREEPVEE